MAHKKDYKPEDIMFPEQRIVQSELVHEMKSSYIDYAMSVIVGRALPDVRDGLKPVHRRILYAMYEDGLTSDKPFKKSATCVGDVLGRYHPHGDASVYDAMVRLAQDFSMRYPLVDGHGNFGSVDGDPPAAYRYTEARMSKLCNEMLRDIDKETVLWDPNFDESRKEPRVLPSRFPNLLVNGSSGIAVGMATNIPPHNLTEVINACICILENPEAELADLMDYIKGPDFPTKGIIMGRSGIRAAYATGRGKITVRARTEFEEFGQNRERIIVTELPYQVNKRQLIANMAEQVRDKRLEGISDIRDETDRNGMRVVIELKKDANPQVVLNRLFAQTQMQTTFGVTMLALVNNQQQPKILSLRHMLDEYLAFQEEIITKRTQYDLKKALDRQHVLQGLLIAEDNIDEVIKTIRESYDNAKERLMERFNLSEIQAQVVLDMQLKRLQGLEREKLEAEYAELEKRIEYYRELLSNEEMLKGVLKDELTAIRDKYGDDRLTEIQDVEDEIDIEDLIEEEQCVFTLSHAGYCKRVPASTYRSQKRGGRGVTGMTTKEEDFVEGVFTASTHDYILFFTNLGKVHRRKGYQIPEAGRTAKGTNLVNILPFEPGEKLLAVPVPKLDCAIIHVQQASPDGTCIIDGDEFHDVDIAIAAKRTIVTCEEIVSDEYIRRDPTKTRIFGECVDAVVRAPYGAWPAQCYGYYDDDDKGLKEYDKASKYFDAEDAKAQLAKAAAKAEKAAAAKPEDEKLAKAAEVAKQAAEDAANGTKIPETFKDYLQKYVYGCKDQDDLLNVLGGARLMNLKNEPHLGYSTRH